jgi:hypothetical protein
MEVLICGVPRSKPLSVLPRLRNEMSDQYLMVAASWSLRNHYTEDLTTRKYGPGQKGHSICKIIGGVATDVYDDTALLHYGFDPDVVAKPRKMCKLCERKAKLWRLSG